MLVPEVLISFHSNILLLPTLIQFPLGEACFFDQFKNKQIITCLLFWTLTTDSPRHVLLATDDLTHVLEFLCQPYFKPSSKMLIFLKYTKFYICFFKKNCICFVCVFFLMRGQWGNITVWKCSWCLFGKLTGYFN